MLDTEFIQCIHEYDFLSVNKLLTAKSNHSGRDPDGTRHKASVRPIMIKIMFETLRKKTRSVTETDQYFTLESMFFVLNYLIWDSAYRPYLSFHCNVSCSHEFVCHTRGEHRVCIVACACA